MIIPMEQTSHLTEASVLIEAEIEMMMLRLLEQDPDGILRLERLLAKVRGDTPARPSNLI